MMKNIYILFFGIYVTLWNKFRILITSCSFEIKHYKRKQNVKGFLIFPLFLKIKKSKIKYNSEDKTSHINRPEYGLMQKQKHLM